MTKRLEITQKIKAALSRSTGNSVNPDTVAVFESASLNTLPLNKKGGLFDQARVSETTLRQMADYLNTGEQYAPLHLSHDQPEGNMPIGRVFAGEVVASEEGYPELRTMFYLPLETGKDLIAKLETSVIDEVSVGLKTQHINCSECGFDYLGADSTFENIWTRTCNNGHEIGVNGTHTLLNGLDKFHELSLVSRGAAQKTKIVTRAKAVLGEDEYRKLAASGMQPEATILFASPTTVKKEPSMDVTKLVDDLTTAKASIVVKDGELTAAKTTIATLEAKVTDLTGQVTTLSANADAAKVTELTTKLTASETTATAALAFIRAEADRLAVAASLTKPADDADLEALQASITASRTKLAETLPVGGAANVQHKGTGSQAQAYPAASFKTR